MSSVKLLAAVIIPLVVFGGFVVFQPFHLPLGPLSAPTKSNVCDRQAREVLVILDDKGMNASVSQGALNLHLSKGETRTILLCNRDNVQAHGFAIDHYFDAGLTLRPGEVYRLILTPKDSGSFTVYCNVFCTVHVYMIGKLTVA